MRPLAGKTALITGGGRGIGAAIARRLAGDGARVAITYSQSRDSAEALASEIGASGGEALARRADNRDPQALEAAVEEVAARHGAVDVLVNNAGIFHTGTIDQLTLEDFDRTMDINVRAVFVASKAAVRHMPDGGRIITIGSNLAPRVPWPGISLYSMSKAALAGFTRGLARDLGGRRINVNVIHPGSTDTDMNPADGEMSDPQRSLMAIQRYSDPSDVAGMVAWLAGPEGRSVTGAEFTIDNGTNA